MRDTTPPGFAAYYAAVLEAEIARTVDASRHADLPRPQDTAMGKAATEADAKAECERMEGNSR